MNLVGQFAGSKLSFRSSGTVENDLLNLPNNWMKNIAYERAFLLTFFACRKKVSRTEGILCENRQDDGAKRAFQLLKRKVPTTAI